MKLQTTTALVLLGGSRRVYWILLVGIILVRVVVVVAAAVEVVLVTVVVVVAATSLFLHLFVQSDSHGQIGEISKKYLENHMRMTQTQIVCDIKSPSYLCETGV